MSVAKSSHNDGPKGLYLGLLFRRGLLPRGFTFFFLSLRLPGGLWNILVRNFIIDVRLDDLLLVFRLQVLETVQLRRLFKGFLEVGDDLGRDAAPMAPSTFFFPKKESVARKKKGIAGAKDVLARSSLEVYDTSESQSTFYNCIPSKTKLGH